MAIVPGLDFEAFTAQDFHVQRVDIQIVSSIDFYKNNFTWTNQTVTLNNDKKKRFAPNLQVITHATI